MNKETKETETDRDMGKQKAKNSCGGEAVARMAGFIMSQLAVILDVVDSCLKSFCADGETRLYMVLDVMKE